MVKTLSLHIITFGILLATCVKGQNLDFYHFQPPKKNKIKSVKLIVSNKENSDFKILGSCNYNEKGLLTDSTDQNGNEFHFEYNKESKLTLVENRIFEEQKNNVDIIYHLKKSFKTIHEYKNDLKITSKHYESDTIIQIITYYYKGKDMFKYMVKDRKANLLGMGYIELNENGQQLSEEYFNGKSQKQFRITYKYDKKKKVNYKKEQWYTPKSISIWEKTVAGNLTTITEEFSSYTDSINGNKPFITKKITEILRENAKKISKESIKYFKGNEAQNLKLIFEQTHLFKKGEKVETKINDLISNSQIMGSYFYSKEKTLEKIEYKDQASGAPKFEIIYQYEFY